MSRETNIYTYVVDHGHECPRVGLKTQINGGKVIVVAFEDYAEKLDEVAIFLRELRKENHLSQVAASIDDFANLNGIPL